MSSYILAGSAQWVAASAQARTVGLFRKETADTPWQQITEGLPEHAEIRDIAICTTDTNRVFAATHVGPYQSADGGLTWAAMPLPAEEVTWSLMLDPSDPETMFCGTVDGGVFVHRGDSLGWRKFEIELPSSACNMDFPTRVICLASDPNNSNELYAALEVGGLVRSLDGGDSWTSCNAGLLEFAERDEFKSRIGSDTDTEGMLDSHAIVVSATQPGTLYLANRMGLFRSPDRGTSWTCMDIGRFSPLTYARDIKRSSHNTDTFFAAFSVAAVSDAGSLYRSTDQGESWQQFDSGVSMRSTLMTVGPSITDPNRVYCATRRGQVFGTEDGGKTWREHALPRGVEGVYAVACA
jgi:photosystem II stability/assembly factor-like uncharacterized protein